MKKKALLWCLKKNRIAGMTLLAGAAVNLSVFLLYGLPCEPFLYAQSIVLAAVLIWTGVDWLHILTRLRTVEQAAVCAQFNRENIPPAEGPFEEAYRAMMLRLGRSMAERESQSAREKQEMQDYYTTWVHQVKTPLAVLKLKLADADAYVKDELFRVEQYVDMALAYIRLDSESTDLVIREYKADDLIRETVRKFAPQFILRRLRLDYRPSDAVVVTDKKWYLCILDQLFSNALKYTTQGTVTISAGEDGVCVSDTGAGIAPEDLPRIFEKGYTGINGRQDRHSSGLGLFLARKAADQLNLTITAESVPGRGSTFRIVPGIKKE